MKTTVIEGIELFYCKVYSCYLSFNACVKRQAYALRYDGRSMTPYDNNCKRCKVGKEIKEKFRRS